MTNVKELRKRKRIRERRIRERRRKFYKRILSFMTIIFLLLISNKFINKYFLKDELISKASIQGEYIDSGKIKVILDPGHGGHDNGASFEDIYEKDIVLSIAKKTGEILEENDIEVIYTRSDDSSLGDYEKEDLANRVNISNSINAEYFISFHINDYEDYTYGYEEVYGFEVWTDYTNSESLTLGQSIESNLEMLNYTQLRPMLDGSETLYIIRENENPSILIEFGFMSSYNDRIYFSNEYNQELLAKAVAKSIIDSININNDTYIDIY